MRTLGFIVAADSTSGARLGWRPAAVGRPDRVPREMLPGRRTPITCRRSERMLTRCRSDGQRTAAESAYRSQATIVTFAGTRKPRPSPRPGSLTIADLPAATTSYVRADRLETEHGRANSKWRPCACFITGGTGLIGRDLAPAAVRAGASSRHPLASRRRVRRDPAMWAVQFVPGDPTRPATWEEAVDGCDAVVNLAGHNLFAERWNARRQAPDPRQPRPCDRAGRRGDRAQASSKPKVLVQGSAIGYYGPARRRGADRGPAPPAPTSWRASAASAEEAAAPVEGLGVRAGDGADGDRAGARTKGRSRS